MTNVNYNLRYVAFLDLLGFKNMVNIKDVSSVTYK